MTSKNRKKTVQIATLPPFLQLFPTILDVIRYKQINFVLKSVRRPSARAYVRTCVWLAITLLVIALPNPLNVATLTFAGA